MDDIEERDRLQSAFKQAVERWVVALPTGAPQLPAPLFAAPIANPRLTSILMAGWAADMPSVGDVQLTSWRRTLNA